MTASGPTVSEMLAEARRRFTEAGIADPLSRKPASLIRRPMRGC